MNTYKKGDLVFFDIEKASKVYGSNLIKEHLKTRPDWLKDSSALEVLEVIGNRCVVEPAGRKAEKRIRVNHDCLSPFEGALVQIPRTAEERKEFGRKLLEDAFSSDTRFFEYYRLLNKKT